MSYIIAYVQFTVAGTSYPVECRRTDVDIGDEVLVYLPNQHLSLKQATVVQVCYLNWNCANQIIGKVSEAVLREDGSWDLSKAPTVVGLATNEVFVAELRRLGWVPLESGRIYIAALTNSNRTASANILVRKNGIDLQMLPARRNALPRPYDLDQESTTEGRVVRHYFAHTTFNLYEGVLRFAASFMSDEGNYDRFFESVGSRDKSGKKLRRSRSQRGEDFLADYHDWIAPGSREPVYLGDGVWVGPGGSIRSRER